jgi:peptide/nickel transport system permease protein
MTSRYLLRRLGRAILTIAAIALLNFVLFRMLPGDPTRTFLPRNVSHDRREQIRDSLGLNLPVLPVNLVFTHFGPQIRGFPQSLTHNQLLTYLDNLAHLTLGDSFAAKRPVVAVIAERVWPTVLLVGLAELLAIVIGLLVGIRAGWKRGGLFDTINLNVALALYAVPLFWLGMILLMAFASPAGLKLFPTGHMTTPGAVFSSPIALLLDMASHLVLPVITLALGLYAGYALIMRSSVVEAMAEDYVLTARAKGLRDADVLRRHVVPNALLPTVTVIALALGSILGGAIGVEQVFTWPGLGTLTINAIQSKDYPVLQGIFLVLTVTVVLANLLADVIYGLLDPRVRA